MGKSVVNLEDYRLKKRMSFNERLALTRQNRGVTQQQLVEKFQAKIDRSVVSKWETGTLRVQPDDVVTVAQALHAPDLLEHYCSECPVCRAMLPKPAA